MDPFSITVGIVGLVDGGLSLSKDLKNKIDDFKNAEREVIELAHEVDLCTTLLDVLGDSLDRPESAYPKNVVKQTRRLVEDMRNVFEEVEHLLTDFEYSTRASAKYMIKAETFRGHHEKLKSLQLSFIFMLSICPAQRPPSQQQNSVGSNTLAQMGSFEGTIQHIPISTSEKDPNTGAPVTYKATLTLQPAAHHVPPEVESDGDSSKTGRPDFTDRLEEARKNKRLKRKLAALTSNPFFSRETFGTIFSRSAPHARTYSAAVPISGDLTPITEDLFDQPSSRMREELRYDDMRKARMKKEEIKIQPRMGGPMKSDAEEEVDEILEYLFDDGEDEPNDQSDGSGADVLEPYPPSPPPPPPQPDMRSMPAEAYDASANLDIPSRQPYRTQIIRPSFLSTANEARSPPSRYSTPMPYPDTPGQQ